MIIMRIPRVSVIITSYNQADLLVEAIYSVLNQTYQDFEVLVVDDGSQDHTLESVEALRKERPDKIYLYTHQGHCNRGIVPTYQLGFSKARGEYVAFLEQDDRWTSNYLAQKVEIFRAYPQVGVVFSPYKVVGERGFGSDMVLRQWLLQSTMVKERPFDNFTNLMESNNVATFSCFTTRRALLEKNPSPNISTVAYDWWILVYLSVFSLFYYDKKSFTYWRWSRDSTIGQQTFETHRDRGMDFMEKVYTNLEQGLDDFNPSKREVFLKHKELFAYFSVFYRKPGLVSFLKFFKRAPVWALSSVASIIINYYKFGETKKTLHQDSDRLVSQAEPMGISKVLFPQHRAGTGRGAGGTHLPRGGRDDSRQEPAAGRGAASTGEDTTVPGRHPTTVVERGGQ